MATADAPARNGCRLRTIQLLLGHQSLKGAAIYLHLSRRHLRAAINPLDQITLRVPDAGGIAGERAGVKRSPWEVADIIRRSGRRFVDRYRDSLTWPTG